MCLFWQNLSFYSIRFYHPSHLGSLLSTHPSDPCHPSRFLLPTLPHPQTPKPQTLPVNWRNYRRKWPYYQRAIPHLVFLKWNALVAVVERFDPCFGYGVQVGGVRRRGTHTPSRGPPPTNTGSTHPSQFNCQVKCPLGICSCFWHPLPRQSSDCLLRSLTPL